MATRFRILERRFAEQEGSASRTLIGGKGLRATVSVRYSRSTTLAVWERRLRGGVLREDLETKHSTCMDFSDESCLARLKVEVLSMLKGIRIGRAAPFVR